MHFIRRRAVVAIAIAGAIIGGVAATASADGDGSGSGSTDGGGSGSGSGSAEISPTGNEHAPRRTDASLAQVLHGPFQSSRLFAMPIADVVGAYMVSISEDDSLLQQPGVLSSEGVIAIGFGDIAQLEYRHTSAISVTGVDEPLPSVGAQLKIPIPDLPNVPALGIARFRLGVERDETVGATTVAEKVTGFASSRASGSRRCRG